MMMAMTVDETEASDAELVGLARAGDEDAFGRLVERHYDFIYRVAYRWCGRKADAEDVAQEVCVRLGAAIRGFAIAKAFAPDQRRCALLVGAADGELEIGAGKAARKAAVLQHVAPLF